MAHGLEKDPSAPKAFGAYTRRAGMSAHPGTNTMRFDVDPSGGPPKMVLHPGLKQWFPQSPTSGRGPRRLFRRPLANLAGRRRSASPIRSPSPPGSGQAMKAAIDGELARYIKEAAEGAQRHRTVCDSFGMLEEEGE